MLSALKTDIVDYVTGIKNSTIIMRADRYGRNARDLEF